MLIRTLLTASAILAATFAAKADTVYTYTGQNFSSALAPVTTSDSLSGSFTLTNPLPAGSTTYVSSIGEPAGAIFPSSWSFTDGVTTFDQTDSLFSAEFYTNPSDTITYWQLLVLGPVNNADYTFGTISVATANGFYDVINVPGGISVSKAEGSFSVTNTPAATPEPSTLALLGTVALGSLFALKLRRQNPIL